MALRPGNAALAGWAGLLGLCCVAASATESTPVAPPPGADMLNLDQYMSGSGSDRIGAFPGTLACIKTKKSFAPQTAEDCGDGRVYVLTLREGAAVPLKAGTDKVREAMQRLVDTKVVVRGKDSTQTGVITASGVESASTAVEAPK